MTTSLLPLPVPHGLLTKENPLEFFSKGVDLSTLLIYNSEGGHI